MKVKCLYNTGDKLPDYLLKKWGQSIELTVSAKINLEYDVFGIYIKDEVVRYLVDSWDFAAPDWIIAEMFEIIDGNIPEGWKSKYYKYETGKARFILGFPKLVDDENYFYRLEDRDEMALYEFRKYLVEYRKEYPLGR